MGSCKRSFWIEKEFKFKNMNEIFEYLDMREDQLVAYRDLSSKNSEFADYDLATGSLHFLAEIREFLKLKAENNTGS